MESDEKYITSRFGKTPHFSVPEGYIEELEKSLLENVEATVSAQKLERIQKAPVAVPLWHRWRKSVAAAVCLAFFGGGAAVWLSQQKSEPNLPVANTHAVDVSAYSYDEIADISMLDNDDIYSLVASN